MARTRNLGGSGLSILFGSALLAGSALAKEPPGAKASPFSGEPHGMAHVRLDLGAGRLDVDSGTLFAVQGAAGKPHEFVFVGKATFVLHTNDPVERYQLEMFTGQPELTEPVDEATLVLLDDAAAEAVTAGPAMPSVDAAVAGRAESSWREWLDSPGRRAAEVPTALFAAAAADPTAQGYFVAWCHSPRLGRFEYVINPWEQESVTVRHFVPLPLGDLDKDAVARRLRGEQSEGRLRDRRVEDLGDWDTWFSTASRGEAGRPAPGSRGFEPDHYVLDLDIPAYPETAETGRARIELHATESGRRVVLLDLFRDLRVSRVRDGAGADLAWHQEGDHVAVVLARPCESGDKVSLDVDYDGVLFNKVESGVYRKRAAIGWYPHVGTADVATYEVTVHHFKAVDVVATGRLAESGRKTGSSGRGTFSTRRPGGSPSRSGLTRSTRAPSAT